MTQTRAYERLIIPAIVMIAAVFIYARLTDFGLWDPWELDASERATTLRSQFPPFNGSAIRLGLSLFGHNAWAGRFFGAVAGIVVVITTMLLSKHITDKRGMAYAGLIALTSPMLILNSQLMVGDSISMATQSILGLALVGIFSPLSKQNAFREQIIWSFVAIIFTFLAINTRGVLLGALPPYLACATAMVIQLPRDKINQQLSNPTLVIIFLTLVITLSLLIGTIYFIFADRSNYSAWLGGTPHGGHPPSFDIGIKNIFHSLAPWSAVAPVAIAHALSGEKSENKFISQHFVLWSVFAYGAYVVFSSRYGTPSYLAIAPLAALISAWMRDVEKSQQDERVSTIIIVLLMGLLLRDYVLYPGSPLSGLPLDGFEMPEGFNPRAVWIIVFLIAIITTILGLFFVKPWKQFATLRMTPLIVSACIFAGWVSFGFVPNISTHFSQRQLYSTYIELRQPSDLLLDYRTSGRATKYYAPRPIELILNENTLVNKLAENQRRWAIFPREDLASINRQFRKIKSQHLFGVDDSNARFVLVTNQVIEGRQNTNILARAIRNDVPQITHPVHAQFGESIELIGYDLELPHQNYLSAGDTFHVTWYWRAITEINNDYEIFLHVDGQGLRLNGDHIPVDGLVPVQTWEPGDVIVDRQTLTLPRNFRDGTYSFYIGLFVGDDRLPVTSGTKDDVNRVIAGQISVR